MTLFPDSTSAAPAPLPRSRRVLTETRSLWHLAWPILIGQLATIGMSVTDVAMAGHASAQDLAGVSLGVSIWNMTILTLMGLLMSVNPMVAHHVGAQEHGAVPHVVRQGLWKALAVGLLAFVLANLAALVFDHMDIEPAVRTVAKDFVWVASFGLPAFTCYRVLYGYSTSINQTKPMMVIALVALVLNGLINWLLVFGNAGFPRLGGVGCAWSTMLCVWFHLLALLWWMRVAPSYRRTWPFAHFEGPQWPMLRSLLKLGIPIGITYFAETSAFSLIALLIAKFGSAQVGAHAIALNFTSLTFMVPLSLGLALLTRVGQSLGANDPAAARFRAWVGVGLTLAFAVVSASGMLLFRHAIAAAYT
ncbi:MAG: MATE family efflux transporter, partial [Rhodoferax sp.]|nr:MATE family efflux transporter [Rhodoferax sp.]